MMADKIEPEVIKWASLFAPKPRNYLIREFETAKYI